MEQQRKTRPECRADLPNRPNILIITTDEERFPPPYENDGARDFRLAHSAVLQEMREVGVELTRHHCAATACAPSRASLYTGHYPSLHGVATTSGMGKSSYDENMFWLEPNTVPTMGNYFREAGYNTLYRGKWHINHADIDIPGQQTSVDTNSDTGEPYPERIALYKNANRLNNYGFDGWIGPEPHGTARSNCATVRDPGYAAQVCRAIDELEEAFDNGADTRPFLLVSSFLNPHDIVLDGIPWFDDFKKMQENGLLPQVDAPPTATEALESKPRCQKDFVLAYPRLMFPQPTDDSYRQFYYYLMAEVQKHVTTVYDRLKRSRFFQNTIVIYTSDHGEMLGAHGGLQQKWYNAYNETLRVPLIISGPPLQKAGVQSDVPTSHIDLMPTILGLAGIDGEERERIRLKLAQSHSEAQPLVGRDLSQALLGSSSYMEEPVYFMTGDNPEVGTEMYNVITGYPYNPIIQPNHVETVITKLDTTGDTLWKYSRYFDNPRNAVGGKSNPDNVTTMRLVPDEYECYNLTTDPYEQHNLMSPLAANPLGSAERDALEAVLKQQRGQKRLHPQTRNLEGVAPAEQHKDGQVARPPYRR